MSDRDTTLELPVLAHCWENVIVWLQLTTVFISETVQPLLHVVVEVNMRQILLRVNLVLIA